MIGVLIVDDSVVARRMLSEALWGDSRLRVLGTAPNGAIALQKLGQLAPDVVVLDVDMPGMDGLETLRHLRKSHPYLPVIMCSALTERGAEITLRALNAGATDYVTKPSAKLGDAGREAFRNELVASVLAVGAIDVLENKVQAALPADTARPKPEAPVTAPRFSLRPRNSARRQVTAIGIGCSTGGPSALSKLLARIPPNLPVPIFVVQHMPPLFTRMLSASLSASLGWQVEEAKHGAKVEPGKAYVAPGDYHMTLGRDGVSLVTLLNQAPHENSCRPAVDPLFRSLAALLGNGVLACVLTGMGRDGARGAGEIVRLGGSVLVQLPETCVVPSMPESVIAAGFAEAALPLDALGDELVARARSAVPPEYEPAYEWRAP
jgi:two-component system chemotaxis response regulator CheB